MIFMRDTQQTQRRIKNDKKTLDNKKRNKGTV